MSRGLGVLQRRVCEVLDGAEGNEVALRELRRRLGEPDRSNLRRAIRGLLEREIVEESRVGGERRVGLTLPGSLGPGASPESFRPRARRQSRTGGSKRALEEALEEARRVLRAETAGRTGGLRSRRGLVRRREVGETQGRILGALWRYSDPLERGLPVSAVKALVGGDRSNARRAIRTLLLNGSLAEIEGGERIRLSSRLVSYYWFVGPRGGPFCARRRRERGGDTAGTRRRGAYSVTLAGNRRPGDTLHALPLRSGRRPRTRSASSRSVR